MSNEELRKPEPIAISSASSDFGATFAKVLEHEFTELAAQLSATAGETDFRRTMAAAVYRTFLDSGMTLQGVAHLLNDAAATLFPDAANVPWSAADNTRRLTLIDLSLQQRITPAESMELALLTTRLRAISDSEQMVPLEGARRLHRALSDEEEGQH